MSNLSQFVGGGKVKKTQVFNSSGTFTPSASLLASGGWVDVVCVGGGGGGVLIGGNGAGGGGGYVVTGTVQVTGNTSVTIGAGGSGTSLFGPRGGLLAGSGGTTSFGNLVVAPGGGRANGEGKRGGYSGCGYSYMNSPTNAAAGATSIWIKYTVGASQFGGCGAGEVGVRTDLYAGGVGKLGFGGGGCSNNSTQVVSGIDGSGFKIGRAHV